MAAALERIAVVQTGSPSELLFTSPLVRVLDLAHPKARLRLVVRPDAAPLAERIPGVDEILPFDERGAGPLALRSVAAALQGFDLVVAARDSWRAALVAWLSKAPMRVGLERPFRRHLFTTRVARREREPLVERAMDFARALGVEGPTALALTPPVEEVVRARAALGTEPAIGLALGGEWPTLRPPAELFAGLAALATESGRLPVLLGSEDDRPFAAEVMRAAAGAAPLDLVGKPARESLAFLPALEGVVGGDCALSHLARAVGTPTVLLFGPTDPGAHVLEIHAQALRLGLDCQPCLEKGARKCPLGHHDCLKGLEVERVWGSLCSLLSRGARP